MKYCSGCDKNLSLDKFHKHKGRKLGVTEYCKPCRNTMIVEKRHGLKSGELDKMKKAQKNKCAICGKHKDSLKKKLAVDHCHKTGKIRGLLCGNCNNGLGRFQDNVKFLEKAIKYLKEKK